MKSNIDRIKSLADTLAALLAQEQHSTQSLISSLTGSLRALQGNTADRRFNRLLAQLKVLAERLDLLTEMAARDFLSKITSEADELARVAADSRLSLVIMQIISQPKHSLSLFCETLLDALIKVTQTERGFVLFYLPESTEAEIVAARNFQTTNLSLKEYNFSRTLLREMLDRGDALLLEDASSNPLYSKEESVVRLGLKSVLAVPLKQNERTLAVLYLENNSHPCAFTDEDRRLLEMVAAFAVSYLDQARLLPIALAEETSVFFDAEKASREIIGRDPKILSLLEIINRLADSPATVLIEGESGTGKELIARALHYQSSRRDHPFVALNCAAIPDTLLESELFGHEKGAFTGALERYIGRIEQGDGGTIFFDEVSELAYPLQAKLLRFLQSNEFDRLGGKQTLKVDVRVVAATSKDLKAMTDAGQFQQALYYRLNVIPVRVPALRERKQDIPLLIDYVLEKFSTVYGKCIRVERDVYEVLKEYAFPGNVRELENLVQRLIALAGGDVISVNDLPGEVLHIQTQRINLEKEPLYRLLETQPASLDELRKRKSELNRILAAQERQLVERVIEETGGNLTEAATRLGMHRVTLHKRLKRTRKKSD